MAVRLMRRPISGVPTAIRAESRDSASDSRKNISRGSEIPTRESLTDTRRGNLMSTMPSGGGSGSLNSVPRKDGHVFSRVPIKGTRPLMSSRVKAPLVSDPDVRPTSSRIVLPATSRHSPRRTVSSPRPPMTTRESGSSRPAPKLAPRILSGPIPRAPMQGRTIDLKRPQNSGPKLRPVNAGISPKKIQEDNDPVTRQMIDRDTLRLRSREMFVEAIRSSPTFPVPIPNPSSNTTNVYIRKRPLFDREREIGEFDVISIFPNSITVHNCLFGPDLKTPHISNLNFSGFSKCFEHESNIFEKSTLSLCKNALEGETGTLFMFGQTGSGKTFTMRSIEKEVGEFLLATGPLTVSFIELSGRKLTDLLKPDDSQLRLRERPDGSAYIEGVTEQLVSSADELAAVLAAAHARRHTEATGANDTSSRSHAVCILKIPSSAGTLMLVDLAGTERRKDSMWHDRERQKESAEINASLHALKECIRWKSGSKKTCAPFRLSALTRILAENFLNSKALLSVIATISPNATDTEHSISTIKTVHSLLGGSFKEVKQTNMFTLKKKIPLSPKKWSSTQVQTWLQEWMDDKQCLPKGTTGPMLIRMSEARFVQFCNGDQLRAARMYKSLHDLIAKRRFGESN